MTCNIGSSCTKVRATILCQMLFKCPASPAECIECYTATYFFMLLAFTEAVQRNGNSDSKASNLRANRKEKSFGARE